MLLQVKFFEEIRKLITHHNLISISGESGTGKTTFALQLIGTLLTSEEPYSDSCIWIQASESFSLKRLIQIFQENKEKLEYAQNSIYTTPQKSLIHTYEQQSLIFHQIVGNPAALPPFVKYIVIDNISNHLRYKLTQYSPKDISLLLNSFYEEQLMPLILFCKRYKIALFLIHEVTYSPKLDRLKPFFYKLYDRIKTIDIKLSKVYNCEQKNLHIRFDNLEWKFQYKLEETGLTII
jgi:RecA/RadA recombinase